MHRPDVCTDNRQLMFSREQRIVTDNRQFAEMLSTSYETLSPR
jgi:hypothetical protein